jgi:hypothetical protein
MDPDTDGDARLVGGDCWLPGRLSRVALDPRALSAFAPAVTLTLEAELYAPWPNQQCTFEAGGWQSTDLCAGGTAEQWRRIQVDVPAADLRTSGGVVVSVAIASPLPPRMATRPIRTGLALRGLVLR